MAYSVGRRHACIMHMTWERLSDLSEVLLEVARLLPHAVWQDVEVSDGLLHGEEGTG